MSRRVTQIDGPITAHVRRDGEVVKITDAKGRTLLVTHLVVCWSAGEHQTATWNMFNPDTNEIEVHAGEVQFKMTRRRVRRVRARR